MQFISESHKEGFFDHVQSTTEGNVLNENQDMIISDKWQKKIVQTKLLPGQCSFHDGKAFFNNKMFCKKMFEKILIILEQLTRSGCNGNEVVVFTEKMNLL